MLTAPRFHHLHLNSFDPEAAIDFYTRYFPTTAKTTWGGLPALLSPNNVLVLFTGVDAPPPDGPQTAFWHFGWHVTDARRTLDGLRSDPQVTLLPMYSGDGDDTVLVTSDLLPLPAGVARTRAQAAAAKAAGLQPSRKGGFGYALGPDGAIVEFLGDRPSERFYHVHMYQDDPLCAQLWYQNHLGASLPAGRPGESALTEENCRVERGRELSFPALDPEGMYRKPSAAVEFGDVALMWFMNQGDERLAGTRGRVCDHIGLGVTDLEAWVAKLRNEEVRFLEAPYQLGDTRAVMIEGPSREALELVEVASQT